MRIVLTGGGTGGHFYPIVAVAEAIRNFTKKLRLVSIELFYVSPNPYNKGVLFEHDIAFIPVSAGKMRRYFSLLNITDVFKTGFGLLKALFKMYSIFPDAVFGKGGYGSVPALFAARIFGIPVMIHESDTVPGRVNVWAGKFAKIIALSYPQAAEHFPKAVSESRVIVTGHPVRDELRVPLTTGAREYLKLEPGVPVVLVLGGSLGAEKINNTILDALPDLVKNFQVIHQTGKENFREVSLSAETLLHNNPNKDRYKTFDYLNTLSMRMCAGASDIVVSRAGSTLFEIAWWGLPSIVIPISDSNGNHQMRNAYAYAETGAAIVLEEKNLKPHVLISEIERIVLVDKELNKTMRSATKIFTKEDASEKLADALLRLAVTHGKRLKAGKKVVPVVVSPIEEKVGPKTPDIQFNTIETISDNVVISDKTTEQLLQEELSAASESTSNEQQF